MVDKSKIDTKKCVQKKTRRRNLLLEIGTEELPPKALLGLSQAFSRYLVEGLIEAKMVEAETVKYSHYATPRRLAVMVMSVRDAQPNHREQRRGPAVSTAFDAAGKATRAAQGFAKSCATKIAKLKRLKTDQGEWLLFEKYVCGETLEVVLNRCLNHCIKYLPVPKWMRWGANEVEFVRPAHWLVALYGTDIVPLKALGLTADRYTMGHRFHAPNRLRLTSANRYISTLFEKGWVIADFNQRQAVIRKQIEKLAKKMGTRVVIDPDLLNEVTGLVEWPHAITGEFNKKFLALPKEVLVSSMREHQKYFHMVSLHGRLQAGFIAISNIRSKSPKRIVAGNQRVLHARLSDAEFFWFNDRKQSLHQRVDDLFGVTFHDKLGTLMDKMKRMRQLSITIAETIGADQTLVARAATLSKADLTTDMVGEFPKLQGIIGSYYAWHDGEAKQVTNAISTHYLPRFAGDKLPADKVSQCIAIADRIDTLVGIFASGEIPTGAKDPYALRRAALGILRILIEKKIDLDLNKCFKQSIICYRDSMIDAPILDDNGIEQLLQFMFERLKSWYQGKGYQASNIAAVLILGANRPLDFHQRLTAVQYFFSRHGKAAQSLIVANKRIANLLTKSDQPTLTKYDRSKLAEPAEINLSKAIDCVSDQVKQDFNQGNYSKAFNRLSKLRHPIDQFFDCVMVLVDDKDTRNNRLALLATIRYLFLGAADISLLQIDK